MADSQILTVIRIWAAMAWADGELADTEAAALRRLIDAAELSGEERVTARGWLEAPVELDEGGLSNLSTEARAGIYRAACRVATIDRAVAEAERSVLTRLRGALGLAPEQAGEIEASIPGLTVR